MSPNPNSTSLQSNIQVWKAPSTLETASYMLGNDESSLQLSPKPHWRQWKNIFSLMSVLSSKVPPASKYFVAKVSAGAQTWESGRIILRSILWRTCRSGKTLECWQDERAESFQILLTGLCIG